MPPLLFDVLAACPATRSWAPTTASGRRRRPSAIRADEPDLAGARDRALLLVGFVAALRRSELAALDVDDVAEHPNGLVLSINPSKTTRAASKPSSSSYPERGTRSVAPS